MQALLFKEEQVVQKVRCARSKVLIIALIQEQLYPVEVLSKPIVEVWLLEHGQEKQIKEQVVIRQKGASAYHVVLIETGIHSKKLLILVIFANNMSFLAKNTLLKF